MKKNCTLCFLFCTVMLLSMTEGCDNDSNTGNESADNNQSVTQVSDESSKIPPDVRKKLDEALNAEPIKIPAEEWTVDTICNATYINGEKISVPLTLHGLGEGFEILEDDSHSIILNSNNQRAAAYLTYYGTYIGNFTVKDCNSEEDIFDAPIIMLSLAFSEFDHQKIVPFSCNGFSVGDSEDKMKERLYFMGVYKESQENGYCVLEKDIEDLHLICNFFEGNLDSFTFLFQSDF
ncbi:MAG: hypothetical protein K2H66_06085 [Oscillospiraceae bacterium]|nr:hypothetical protein [Oscillospiraceae bacterium]